MERLGLLRSEGEIAVRAYSRLTWERKAGAEGLGGGGRTAPVAVVG